MIPTTSDLPPDRIFHAAKVLTSRANVVSLQGINNSEAGFSYPLLSRWTSPLRVGTKKWCGRKLNFQVHGSTIPAQAVAGRPFSLSLFVFYFIFFVCCDFNCTFQIPNYNGDLNTVEMWCKIHLISNSIQADEWTAADVDARPNRPFANVTFGKSCLILFLVPTVRFNLIRYSFGALGPDAESNTSGISLFQECLRTITLTNFP